MQSFSPILLVHTTRSNTQLLRVTIPHTPKRALYRRSTGAKAALKMMVIVTPGVDFTYILRAAFESTDPKSAKYR